LYAACLYGNFDCVELLLSNSADPNVCDIRGTSPLMLAAKQGFWEITQILLRHNASASITDIYGKKPVDRAKNLDIITLLQNKSKNSIKRSKSLIPSTLKLFSRLDKQKFKKTELGKKIETRIKQKVAELKNKVFIKNENLVKETIQEKSVSLNEIISKSIKKWIDLHMIGVHDKLKDQVDGISKSRPPTFDLESVFGEEYKSILLTSQQRFKDTLSQSIKRYAKRSLADLIYATKQEIFYSISSAIKKTKFELDYEIEKCLKSVKTN
jgi:Ankyrin repeats (3 copies)